MRDARFGCKARERKLPAGKGTLRPNETYNLLIKMLHISPRFGTSQALADPPSWPMKWNLVK